MESNGRQANPILVQVKRFDLTFRQLYCFSGARLFSFVLAILVLLLCADVLHHGVRLFCVSFRWLFIVFDLSSHNNDAVL